MEKMTVVVSKGLADGLVRSLMRSRAVSLSEPPRDAGAEVFAKTADADAVRERLARIDKVLPELTKRSLRKKKIFGPQTPLSPAEFESSGRRAGAAATVDETLAVLDERAALFRQLEKEESDIAALTPFLPLKLPLDFDGTDTTAFYLGLMPAGVDAGRAREALADLAAECSVISEAPTGVALAVTVYRADAEAALSALSGVGFVRSDFAGQKRAARYLLKDARHRIEDLQLKIEKNEEHLARLAENLTDVEMLWDTEKTTLLAEENKAAMAATDNCVFFSGWCPRDKRERVVKLLEKYEAAYEFSLPQEGDDVPVLLKNNGFARNFEWVLGMYAYPRYGTFDPTFIMSIFYFLIFGLMFADAGYGLVLSVVCFAAVRWLHPRESMKRFLLMFGYCGISCIICGVLFGAYFGDFPLKFLSNVVGLAPEKMPNLSILPTTEPNLAVLFDPLQNPMAFLLLSLGVGAVHLVAGMAVHAVVLCKNGRPQDALFDVVTYWVLFAGIGVVFLNRTVGLILIIVGALSIVLTQGRSREKIGGKIVGGLGGLYGLINYASDLLSYSRILALGLAAGVIGQVVNILATLKGASFIGFILMILVFTVGHLLNLAINVLGTFVHTSRLQYIEFFGKFYEDGGTPFRPIAPSDRYTVDAGDGETPVRQ